MAHVQKLGQDAEQLFKEMTNAKKTEEAQDKQNTLILWAEAR